MKSRDKTRLQLTLEKRATGHAWMRGTATILGDIVSPAWDGTPWDAELGIAYHRENGPIYWVNGELKETDQ